MLRIDSSVDYGPGHTQGVGGGGGGAKHGYNIIDLLACYLRLE